MNTGQRAMATALVLEADGRRIETKTGRRQWRDGTLRLADSPNADFGSRLKECGVILDFAPKLAAEVVAGGGGFSRVGSRSASNDGRGSSV